MNQDVSQSTPDDSWIDGVVSFILWSAILVFATVPSISRMDDPDLWGHLKTGEWILENRDIPQTDPFTVNGE